MLTFPQLFAVNDAFLRLPVIICYSLVFNAFTYSDVLTQTLFEFCLGRSQEVVLSHFKLFSPLENLTCIVDTLSSGKCQCPIITLHISGL